MKTYLCILACVYSLACPAQTPDAVLSNNQFTFDFYKSVLAKQKGNAFASPFSISSAFAMVYAGAEGETKDEISRVLHFSDSPDFHTKQAKMQADMQSSLPKELSLEVANALWVKQGLKFLPAYRDLMASAYKAKMQNVDFDKPKEACKIINDWTNEKTRKKIKEIVLPDNITPLTSLILTNAVYFKANWKKSFDKEKNQTLDFYMGAEAKVQTTFMHAVSHYTYMENDELQMIELPYTNNKASMVVLLPREGSNLENLEAKLSWEQYQKWATQMPEFAEVYLYLPKFKIENSFGLVEEFKKMGLTRSFEEGAQFGKILENVPLHISDILHKSFVEVKEEGTEAAAVTAIMMKTSSVAKEKPRHKVFMANRPFVFLIKDNQTGAILFVGKVQKPS